MAERDPKTQDNDPLDAAFATLRSRGDVGAPRALRARVLAEAARVARTHRTEVTADADAATPPGVMARLGALFGGARQGWGTGLAFAACACFGLWLGYGDPVGLQGTPLATGNLFEAEAQGFDPEAVSPETFFTEG